MGGKLQLNTDAHLADIGQVRKKEFPQDMFFI